MKKNFLTLTLLMCFMLISAAPIGTWKAYLAYQDITEIEKGGDVLYVLASKHLYSYNTNDQSIQTFDKTNLLSDCNIDHIAWCQQAQRLVIMYDNQNIDLLEANGNVINVSDYYSKSISEDKTVYSLYVSGNNVYICTGFGIIKLDVSTAEILETYMLGFRVDFCYLEGNYLYAASSTNGLYRGSTTANLIDSSNWSRVGDYTAQDKEINADWLAIAKTLNPGGPKYDYHGFMRFKNNKLYSCGGGYNVTSDLHREGCVQILSGDDWTVIDDPDNEYFLDFNALDVDPKDENHIFACGRTGLFEFNNGSLTTHYSYDNSPLISPFGDNKMYVVVQGLCFDDNGTLWLVNSMSNGNNLLSLDQNKQWSSHYKDALKSLANVSSLNFDSNGYLWMSNNNYVKPAFYNYTQQPDTIYTYDNFVNEDGTKVNLYNVRCTVEDLSHNIWAGTDAGPVMLRQQDINNADYVLQQIKVPRNDGTDYADYLLSGIDITCMAIDAAGRKWFGTSSNGVYLISEDNMTQEQHFLEDNSKLLSNNIESIAINDDTGEVFFGTSKGLCSYMSNATTTSDEMDKDNVWAYPNPVRPDYTGLVTITGLSYDADIKITTSNGVLVNEGRSNGGTYTWNLCDTKGRRVASGVYMVLTAKQDGSKGTVCKIAVVN